MLSVPRPYWPMMKAMAPNAPMGATFMIQDMILKISSRTVSMRLMTGRQRSRPMTTMAAPKNTEKNSTCSRLLLAKAPITLAGMTSRMNAAASLGGACAGLGVEGILGQRGGIDVQAGTGLDEVADDQPEDQGEESGAGEVEERFDPDPSDRLDVAHGRDARDDHQENQRGDDHLDELNESIAQWPEGGPNGRPKMTDEYTCDDGDQDLKKERLVQPLFLLRGRTRLQRRGVWDLH